jgi:hypothetical protein
MAKPRILWRGTERAYYKKTIWKTINGQRVQKIEVLAAKLGSSRLRKVNPRFSQQMQRLLQGTLKRFPQTWLHELLGADIRALAKDIGNAVRSASLRVGAYGKKVIAELKDAEWAQLRAKASYIAKSVRSRIGIQFQVKGLIHEITGIRRMFASLEEFREAKAIRDEMAATIQQAPDAHKWDPEVFMTERAHTRSASGGGEVGDLVFFAMRDRKDPSKGIWVLGIGNQKSAGNANHLLSHLSIVNPDPKTLEEGIPKYGEFLGQSSMDVERVTNLGIEIPGVGKFHETPGTGEGPLKISWKNCLRIGVVPVDTRPGMLMQLENLAQKESNFRLLKSPLPDKDAEKFADAVIDSVEN